MHCMHHKSNSLTFQDPQEKIAIKYIMTGFVDDTTHWVNNFESAIKGKYSINAMYQDTQQTAQWWEQLLHATGGKLELPKCFYYPIIWNFDDEGIPQLEPTIPKQIHILSSETGARVRISSKSPHDSHKTLGIMENPSGNYDDEYNSILFKAQKWKNSISNQYLSCQESKIFYQSFFLPSIRYHLTVGTFTNAQLHQIQHPTLQLILPRILDLIPICLKLSSMAHSMRGYRIYTIGQHPSRAEAETYTASLLSQQYTKEHFTHYISVGPKSGWNVTKYFSGPISCYTFTG